MACTPKADNSTEKSPLRKLSRMIWRIEGPLQDTNSVSSTIGTILDAWACPFIPIRPDTARSGVWRIGIILFWLRLHPHACILAIFLIKEVAELKLKRRAGAGSDQK